MAWLLIQRPSSAREHQHSILELLLVILHINDLLEVVSKCNILMYADDTVLYCSSSQAPVIQDKLNAEQSKIEHWLSLNCLFVNNKNWSYTFRNRP